MRTFLLVVMTAVLSLLPFISYAQAPSFEDFVGGLQQGDDAVYTIEGVDADKSIQQNIANLFWPDASENSVLRRYVRILGVLVFVLMLMAQGVRLLLNPDDESVVKKATSNVGLIFLGALIFFSATWIVGSALNIAQTGDGSQFATAVQNRLLFQVLAMLKAGAFFVAILMLAVTGFKIMAAMDSDDKIKKARQGIVNIIVALIFIKIIDFIYYIAQKPSFTNDISSLVISAAKLAGRAMGAALVVAVIYGGYLLITDNGSGESAKKAGNLIINVFVVGIVLFLFLLIIYQLIAQFGG